MHEINIRSLDLNLLLALSVLLEEKHVSRAALRMGLSQPAMSRSLSKLRDILKDPVLVKAGSGYDLSARAQELHPKLRVILSDIQQVLTPAVSDPKQMEGEIVLATRDNEMVTILPEVMNRIGEQAPKLSVKVVSFAGDDLTILDQNKVDFVITGTESDASTLFRSLLYKEDFVCLISVGHPLSRCKKLTLSQFLSLRHCLVSLSGFGLGWVDELLAKKGLSRTVSLKIPHFLAASYLAASTHLIVTLPRKVGLLFSKENPQIKVMEPPIHIPHFNIYLYWHVRNQNNPIHQWVRKLIRKSCERK